MAYEFADLPLKTLIGPLARAEDLVGFTSRFQLKR